MTKVEAIVKVMNKYNGLANWSIIYNEIEEFYPKIKEPADWTAALRGVLYREIKNKRTFKKIDEGLFALIDYDESLLLLDEDKNDTETDVISKIRKGQEQFRKKLLKTLKSQCPITLIDDKRLLIASHIKPWAFSNSTERLDTNNGFVLSALFDKLFDQGLITFSLEKRIIVSKALSIENMKRIGIQNNQLIEKLAVEGRESYLDFHKEKVFLQ